ncbi:YceI family protein [Dyadobacter psychrophilus]|uniref:Polyisoprenoid-binding protein YceI n=1 Tax=Dyadobacter psychrophilus TaxID=651661 RepID=A0A1T5ENX1_9BACT|nr:YceI family protein [Dyadobacter psychrophilus]SKB85672.1 Polyisoprenoid-binding protein YceI [Dyadobacter psychrophilus]
MKKQLLTLLALISIGFSCTDHDVETTNYKLDEAISIAEWKGYLRNEYFNEGSIAIKSESLIIRDGKVQSGSFTIPIASIVNFNLPTEELKQTLVHHLQSADFFNMALHPEVKFNITGVAPYTGTGEGVIAGANQLVNGNLTMLGITHSISFPARIEVNGSNLKVEGKLKIDRTKWGITYATDPALPDDAVIKNEIDLHLKLAGNKL